MKDNVNVGPRVRHSVMVRPFMGGALHHAEARLVEKAENAPESWDDVDHYRLVRAAHRKTEDFLAADFDDPIRARKDIADAINYLGMAYDTLEQLEVSR